MIFIDDYTVYSFTKVETSITLRKCPSDHENGEYFVDISCDNLYQKKCYVGGYEIEDFRIQKIKGAYGQVRFSEPKWNLDFVIHAALNEDEIISLLEKMCTEFSCNLIRLPYIFQYSGWRGFTFRLIDIKRSYANESRDFGETDFNSRGTLKSRALQTVTDDVFRLPATTINQDDWYIKLIGPFLTAMQSTDPVARFILLYYLFEIMYSSEKYIEMGKSQAKNIGRNKKRAIILYQFILDQFQVDSYASFGTTCELRPEIIEKIIITRNNITHRADTSSISELMYRHLVPILKTIICAVDMKPGFPDKTTETYLS